MPLTEMPLTNAKAQTEKVLHLRWYTEPVPTNHPRIAVVRDPELDAALEHAAQVLGEKRSTAALLRELALLGVQSLPSSEWVRTMERMRALGLQPAQLPPGDVMGRIASMGPVDPENPTPATDALEYVRADRI
ncbi:MAG TPA: hypothetical protein VIC06_04280 [Solirubrobacteraceae bacterium]|jgi:hypothetical protein